MQRVLIVEDDEDILFIVSFLLEEKGLSVMPLSDCKKAVAAAMSWKPHLILFDVNLGLCDGRQLCLELKTKYDFKAPILLFSANSELVADLGLFKADGFIQKPFEADELVNTIQKSLNIA